MIASDGTDPLLRPASQRGRLKVYIGMSAGVGKTYRMLEEVRDLMEDGVNVQIGYVETHRREETHALLEGLPIIPRREVFYKGKRLEEFDLSASEIARLHGPVGLYLGSKTPPEIAVSVLAEMTAVKNGVTVAQSHAAKAPAVDPGACALPSA